MSALGSEPGLYRTDIDIAGVYWYDLVCLCLAWQSIYTLSQAQVAPSVCKFTNLPHILISTCLQGFIALLVQSYVFILFPRLLFLSFLSRFFTYRVYICEAFPLLLTLTILITSIVSRKNIPITLFLVRVSNSSLTSTRLTSISLGVTCFGRIRSYYRSEFFYTLRLRLILLAYIAYFVRG